MRFLRPLPRLLALLVLVFVCLPPLALIPSAFLFEPPGSGAAFSLFPAALTVWDPFVWDAVWNSVLVAALSTWASCLVGVSLGRVFGPWRFWGRPPLRWLIALPVVLGPFLNALGLRFLTDHFAVLDRIREASGRTLFLGLTWETWLGWSTLVAANILTGAMLAAWATETALAQIDPRWIEAGRALGASRRQTWRDLIRPNLRPTVARVAGWLFALFIIEPGAPFVVRLPRTLAFQICEAIRGPHELARPAVMCLLAVLAILLFRAILARWAGRAPVVPAGSEARPQSASFPRTLASWLLLLTWGCLAVSPLLGIGLALVGRHDENQGLGYLMSLIYYQLLSKTVVRTLAVSGLLGLVIAASGAVMAGWMVAQTRGFVRRLRVGALRVLRNVPPLAIGAGTLSLVPLSFAFLSSRLGTWLEPIQTPGVVLVLATWIAWFPTLMRHALSKGRMTDPRLVETALAFGASPRQARRSARRGGAGLRATLLVAVLAGTSLSPALILCPASDVRPIGPAVLDAVSDPPRAAALAILVVVARILAFALASSRWTPPRLWLVQS